VEQSIVERGYRWIARGDYNKAIETFSSALKMNPQNILALVGRGDALAEKKEYIKAFVDYDLAISCWEHSQVSAEIAHSDVVKSNTSETFGKRPFSYQNQGLTVKYGLGTQLYYHRGVCWYEYAKQGEWYDGDKLTNAVADYTKAIELNPNNVEAYINRAAINHMVGNLQQALNDYDKALELTPKDEKVKTSRAKTLKYLRENIKPQGRAEPPPN
jgi:tetratricopeptide (TPR) repeat protein